jgi:hypothetical protein
VRGPLGAARGCSWVWNEGVKMRLSAVVEQLAMGMGMGTAMGLAAQTQWESHRVKIVPL